MESYPVPENEEKRLKAVKQLNILDTPAEDRFDRITRLACDSLNVDKSAINLVDSDRQWGKSTCGIESTEASRDHSFCTHALVSEESLIIDDTLTDDRFRENPLVKGPPNIRFYMGCPIHDPNEYRIGTLCVFDSEPRTVSDNEKRIIRDLASIVDSEIERDQFNVDRARLREQLEEAQRRSRIDELTDLWNRRAVFDLLKAEVNRSNRDGLPLSIAMVDLDDFKAINDTYGHQAGDKVLRVVARDLRQSIRDYNVAGRYGGEEFMIIFPESNRDEISVIAERVRTNIKESSVEYNETNLTVTASIGVAVCESSRSVNSKTMVGEADKALYAAKDRGKDTVCYFSSKGVAQSE